MDKIKQFPFCNWEMLTGLNSETLNTNTNKQVGLGLLEVCFFLFARYKVQGTRWFVKQTEPELTSYSFRNMLWNSCTALASNREGGVGFDLHFRSVRCTRPKLRFFPPYKFSQGRADAMRELLLPVFHGPSPPVFRKRDPDSSHLALKKESHVRSGFLSCRSFGFFRDAVFKIFTRQWCLLFPRA